MTYLCMNLNRFPTLTKATFTLTNLTVPGWHSARNPGRN